MGAESDPQFLSAILDASADALVVVDERGLIRYANAAAGTLSGWVPAELVGREVHDLVPAELAGRHRSHASDFLASPRARAMGKGTTLALRHADGRSVPVEIALTPMGDRVLATIRDVSEAERARERAARHEGHSGHKCLECVLTDATERHEANLAADAARAELEAWLANAPDYVLYLDREGRIRYVNRVEHHATTSELIGRSIVDGAAPESRDAVRHALDRVLLTGQRQCVELVSQLPDGSRRSFANHFAPVVRAGEIAGIVCIARDITEQKALQAQLAIQDRLASVGMLSAGIMHEINNPLMSILANLWLLQREPLTGTTTELLEEVREAAEVIRTLVTDVRQLSRGCAQTEPIDVIDVIESSLRLARHELRDRARLELELAPVPPVRGSASRLGQVLLNLIVNAAQAIPPGGAQDNHIRIATRREAGLALIEISDTGVGMSEDQVQRLFTPFFTTKGEGTGLGLSISQRIVESMSGTIAVESKAGIGSRFTVRLPVAAESRRETSWPVTSGHESQRLVVIDDDPSVGRTLTKLLAEHRVESFTDPEAAIARLSTHEPVDLVLCNVLLPETNGIQVLSRLARSEPAIAERRVFMTGGALSPSLSDEIVASGRPVIEKPFARSELLALVACARPD